MPLKRSTNWANTPLTFVLVRPVEDGGEIIISKAGMQAFFTKKFPQKTKIFVEIINNNY